jgi:serine/threonine protein kinase
LYFGGPLWEKAVPGHQNYDSLANGWDQWNKAHENTTEEIPDDDYPYAVPFNVIKPPALRRVLLRMLNPDPAKRLTIEEVYNDRWVKRIECCQPENPEDQNKGIDATKAATGKKICSHNHLPGKSLDTGLIGNSNFD